MPKLSYFLLNYAATPIGNDCISIGMVVFDPNRLTDGYFGVWFSPSWQARVKSIDTDADIEMLEALFQDIKSRLEAPSQRLEMLTLIQDSFSNTIRVSEKKECTVEESSPDVASIAAQFL